MKSSSELITRAESFFRYGTRLKPLRDWVIVLVLFAIGIGVSVGWNSVLFLRVTRGEVLEAAAPASTVNSQDSIEKIRSIFTHRVEEAEKYRSEYNFVDPSRP